MLINANRLHIYHLHARDGDIGYVHDLLFHDDQWNVRYVVVDTSQWLRGNKVLLIPDVLSRPNHRGKMISTELVSVLKNNSGYCDSSN